MLIFVSGEVLLDGENIKNLNLEWLRGQIGLVTQEPALLSLSIKDNIAYGRDVTMDQIEEAAKIAHAHTFISSLEKGYDTQVMFGWHDHLFMAFVFWGKGSVFSFVSSQVHSHFYIQSWCSCLSGWQGRSSFDRRAENKTFYCKSCASKSIDSSA
jgi:hypothetical protein